MNHLVVISLIFALVGAYGAECGPADHDLVGYWNGDLTPLESEKRLESGWKGPAEYRAGVREKSFAFGGGSHIEISHNEVLNFKAMTFEAWVYPTGLDGQVNIIVNKEHLNPPVDGSFEIGIRGRQLGGVGRIPVGNLAIYFGGISGMTDDFHGWSDGGSPVPINQWSHVAVSFGNGAAAVYLNGALGRSWTNLTGHLTENSGPLRIGSRSPAVTSIFPDEAFKGLIDEVAIYSRALTPSDVRAAYEGSISSNGCAGGEIQLVVEESLGMIDPVHPAEWVLQAGTAGRIVPINMVFRNSSRELSEALTLDVSWSIGELALKNMDGLGLNPGPDVSSVSIDLDRFKDRQIKRVASSFQIKSIRAPSARARIRIGLRAGTNYLGRKFPVLGFEAFPVGIPEKELPLAIGFGPPNLVRLTWPAETGHVYRVEWGQNESDGRIAWKALGDWSALPADVSAAQDYPVFLTDNARFYRVARVRIR